MTVVAVVGWILIGFIQLAAIVQGLQNIFGRFLGAIFALVLGQMPLIGTIMGIFGAIRNWNWEWWQAVLLFCGAPIIGIILSMLSKER